LLNIVLNGALTALRSISSPIVDVLICWEAFNKAIPPPGTIPSLIAALVAHIASSTLSFNSCSSTSELAPTFTTATLPDNLANLVSSFIISFAFLVEVNLLFISSIKPLTSSDVLPTWIIVSWSLLTLLTHWPNCSGPIKSISSPKSSFITVAPCGSTSAITNKDLLFFITYSSTFCIFLTFSISDSTNKINGLSNSAVLVV